jgi:hypothetical protein
VEGFEIETMDRLFLRVSGLNGLRLHFRVHFRASLFRLAVSLCLPALSETLSNTYKILLKPQP